MAEAMCDEVAAGSMKPADDVQPDPAGAHTEDAASGRKPPTAGHGQHVSDAGEATLPETKPPRPDEVRRSAAESQGQTSSDAKKDQGTSLNGGKADPKGEVGAEGTTTAEATGGAADSRTRAPETAVPKEAIVPDRQAVCETHSDQKISSTADTAPSGNEAQQEALSYEPFWKATERGANASEKPEIPRRKRKKAERPGVTFQNQPTIVEQAAQDTNAQEVVDSTVAVPKEAVAPDRQAVCETHSDQMVPSTADTAPSGNEAQEEALSYEPFWKATERGANASETPEIPRRKRKKAERPGVTFQNQPTVVEQAAQDTNAQEVVDSTVAEFQISNKPPDLGAATKANSTLSLKRQSRGERLPEKEDLAADTTGEQYSGTLECIVTNEQQPAAVDSTAIDSTKEAPTSFTTHERNTVEAEATTKRGIREITPSKPMLTSATSLSNCTQEGAFEGTSGPICTEATDKKPDTEKKSSTDHGGASKIPDQAVETDGPLSSDSSKVISITLRPETGGKELESMTEASEATLKVIPLSESVSDKKSTNKAKKVAEAKQASNIFQPGGANEVSELSASVQEETIGVPLVGNEVGQVSVDSKMESTVTDNEASKPKAPISKKSKKQKGSLESTNRSNAAQEPTKEAPSSEVVRQEDSYDEQIPTKTPGEADAKDQIQRKQSQRKPTKSTKKDSTGKQEAVSEPPDINTGASADAEVTVGDLHMSKTDTETSATVAKDSASSEKPALPKTALAQESASKDTKKQPRRKRSTTQAADTNKPTDPPAESAVKPSGAATTDHDESVDLPPAESNEVNSKSTLVDGMKAKAQFNKTTGPQKRNNKNTKKTVAKTGSSSTIASGSQKKEDTVAPVAGNSTTKFPTDTKSVSSVTIKKDVTKTESDNAKRNQKRNAKATKTQQGKGRSIAATTKSGSKPQQQAESISDQTSAVTAPEDTVAVKTVVESENSNTKLTKANPGRKLNNKTTTKKSDQPSTGDSQKDKRSSQEASIRTELAIGTSVANDGNVSSSKTLSAPKKSNNKLGKDQIKPVDSAGEAEKKTVKATESDKNETLPSGSATQNKNNGIQTAELVTQSSEGDPHGSNEESQKNEKVIQRKPERRNAPVRENKRKTPLKSNEKQSAGTAKKETSADNLVITPNEMQESGAKADSSKRNAQTSDSRPSDRYRNRNTVRLIVNRVEIGKEGDVPDCPVAPTETSLESTVNGESSTVHAAADTTEQNLRTTIAEKVESEASPRKKSSSQKKARKEKASLKKLEEVCTDSDKEPPIGSNEISTTNPGHVTESIKTERTDIELESTALAAKSVGAKTRLSKSPSDLKRKSKVANPQLKKSSSLVAIPKSKSKTTVLVDGAKVPTSGDTGLTKAKTVPFKKSESFTAISMDNIKQQSIEDKGRPRIWSLKQQKTSREERKTQTSLSKAKNTKEEDSVPELQHPTSKPVSSFTKEGKTESNVPAVFEESDSALKDAKRREENKQLATINSDEADSSGKSPRKTKGDQNRKREESIQNIGTGDVDRSTKIQSKAPQEKSVGYAELARITPGGKPQSPRLRRQKLSQHKEETKGTPESKVPDAAEDASKTAKDVTEEKAHAARKGDVPASGLPKHGNSPSRRADEEVVAEAKQKPVCVKHETRTNDKLNNVDSTQKKPGQVKHETVPTTVTVTLKAGDNKGTVNKSAGDTARTGETVECTISTSVAKKKEQRSSKLSEQTSTVGEKMVTTGPSTMSGDGVKAGSPRKQTAEQKDLKVKAKKMDGICVVIEEVPQEQKSKALEKQRVGTNQEELTNAKETGQPPSSPRKSPTKSPRGVSKTTPAAGLRPEVSPEINSLDQDETKGAARIAIVQIEENDVTVSYRDRKKSSPSGDASSNTKYCGNDNSAKALEKGNTRESNISPRSKQTTTKKVVIPSVRAYEHSEDTTAPVLTQRTSKTDASAPKRNGSNGSENPRSTSPQRLIAQLRSFMTEASLLNKLDLKTKILDCIGVNQVRDGYKIPASRGKVKTPTTDVTDLKKVAAALKVGRKRLEDQTSGKVLEKSKAVSTGGDESKKEILADVGKKSSIAVAEEARNKLFTKAGNLRGGKHRDRRSTTGSSGFSSSSGTPRPILVKERARKRKVHKERKGVPRVRFNETTSGLTTTSSSRPSHPSGSKRQRWVSATPEIPARVKQVSPRRYAAGTTPKIPVGIVSSTMLALKRMRASSAEQCRTHSPSPSRRPSKPLPSAAAAIMAVTMKARELAKVPRHGETRAAAERRSRSPNTKRATARGSDRKRSWKSEQRAHEVVIRGLTAAAAPFSAEDRTEDLLEFASAPHTTKRRERTADEYDRTPIIPQTHSEVDKPVSPRRDATEKVMPTWNSGSFTPSPTRKSSRSPTAEKSPTLRVLHDNKRPVRTKTTVINSSPTEVPCSVAITKKTSVPAQSVKRATRKGVGSARAAIEHVVNIDIRMGSMAKDSTVSEDGRGRPETPAAKSSVATKDSSVGTEEMQVLDVRIRALPADRGEGELDETSVHTLLRAKEKSESGAGDVDAAGRESSESLLALTDMQAAGAGDRVPDYAADGEGDEDSGAESDTSSKTWPRATLVTPTTKTLAASFPRFSTSSVPEEAARSTAALERSLRLVSRACQSRPLECDLRWSAWMSALHAGDPDAAATPFPASLSRSGRRDVDAALAAAVRVPALWLLAGLRAAELGARTVKLLHWLLVRLPAEGPALRAIDTSDIKSPCKPSAAFKVRVCAGSALDARLRWRSRGLPAFEAWASPSPCQLHALVCGGASTPIGVLSLTLAGALRRAQPGYGSGASRLGSRLRCVLKCDVAHHPELVERIGADAVVVRGLDLVRVRQLLVFSEPLPEGALAAWAARAIKKRRLAVAIAAILLTYLLVAAIVWMAELGIVGVAEGPNLFLGRLLTWSEEPEPSAPNQKFSFWA